MKVLYLFLLAAGPFVVCGQQRAMPHDLLQRPGGMDWKEWRPGGVDPVFRRQWMTAKEVDVVRVMSPDRMRCFVPDMTRVEPMPVNRSWNADKMPSRVPGKEEKRRGRGW